MGRHRGIGRKRKGKKQGAPTPTKKSRMRVQQVSAEKAKKHLHDTREVENWITKMNEIASEAGVTAKKGLGYGAGEARIIIRAVISTIFLFSRIQPSQTLDYKSFSKFRLPKWRVPNWLGTTVDTQLFLRTT